MKGVSYATPGAFIDGFLPGQFGSPAGRRIEFQSPARAPGLPGRGERAGASPRAGSGSRCGPSDPIRRRSTRCDLPFPSSTAPWPTARPISPFMLVTRTHLQFNPASDHRLDLVEFQELSGRASIAEPGAGGGAVPRAFPGRSVDRRQPGLR